MVTGRVIMVTGNYFSRFVTIHHKSYPDFSLLPRLNHDSNICVEVLVQLHEIF